MHTSISSPRLSEERSRTRWSRSLAAGTTLTLLAALAALPPSSADASSFTTWNQTFNHDADEWVGAEVEGPAGWCGSIERHTRGTGPVSPSIGRGYAVATGGACNDFYADPAGFGPDFRSGPFAAGTPLSSDWPASGFTMQTDVHLDPGSAFDFDYYGAISLLDVRAEEGLPASVRYFEVPVRTDGGALTVLGRSVDSPGWHTFTHRFSQDPDGSLSVEFELSPRSGAPLFTAQIEEARLFGGSMGATSSFEAANVGSAYVWLHLAEDDQLPIDAYRLKRGR